MNLYKLPKKAWRHIRNFFRFSVVYFIVATFVETGQTLHVWEHYALIEAGITAVLVFVTIWFSWRFYTGMFREFDFYDEE